MKNFKIKNIIAIRLRENKNFPWLSNRRECCIACPKNTNNIDRLSILLKIKIYLNNLFNYIFSQEGYQDIGVCSICGCDNFEKTKEPTEECSDKENKKWKSIYIPNTKNGNKITN